MQTSITMSLDQSEDSEAARIAIPVLFSCRIDHMQRFHALDDSDVSQHSLLARSWYQPPAEWQIAHYYLPPATRHRSSCGLKQVGRREGSSHVSAHHCGGAALPSGPAAVTGLHMELRPREEQQVWLCPLHEPHMLHLPQVAITAQRVPDLQQVLACWPHGCRLESSRW